MFVERKMTVETESFELGDVIKFKLTDGEKVKAMAVRKTSKGMLFVTVDCVGSEQPMFNDLDGMESMELCYANSDLRHYLKDELLPLFPEEIKSRMVGMRIGNTDNFDLLRIPTEKEIFGENQHGKDEGKVKQFKGMKKRRNRIAFDRSKGKEDWQWYWLQNRHKEYASNFASANHGGSANCLSADWSYGVRPVFLLTQES